MKSTSQLQLTQQNAADEVSSTIEISFLTVLGLEVQDQGAGRVGFWWELSLWLADGCFVSGFPCGFSQKCELLLKKTFLYLQFCRGSTVIPFMYKGNFFQWILEWLLCSEPSGHLSLSVRWPQLWGKPEAGVWVSWDRMLFIRIVDFGAGMPRFEVQFYHMTLSKLYKLSVSWFRQHDLKLSCSCSCLL